MRLLPLFTFLLSNRPIWKCVQLYSKQLRGFVLDFLHDSELH
jgi:hypothetical protein